MKELKMFVEILASKKVSETIILDLQLFLAELRQKVADELLKPLGKNEYFKEKEFESAIKLVDELVEKMLTIENIKKEHISIGDEVSTNYHKSCDGITFVVEQITEYSACSSGFIVLAAMKDNPERKIYGLQKEGMDLGPPGIDSGWFKKIQKT